MDTIQTTASDDVANTRPTMVGRPSTFSSYLSMTVCSFPFIDLDLGTNGDSYHKAANLFEMPPVSWALARTYTLKASSPLLQTGVLGSSPWTARTSLPLVPALIDVCQWLLMPINHPWHTNQWSTSVAHYLGAAPSLLSSWSHGDSWRVQPGFTMGIR